MSTKNRIIDDVRMISLYLTPFREVERINQRLEVRFVRLTYNIQKKYTQVEVKGVGINDNTRMATGKMRTLLLRDPKTYPKWVADLVAKHMPSEFRYPTKEEARRLARRQADHRRAVRAEYQQIKHPDIIMEDK